MIKIEVWLLPGGSERDKRLVGKATIENVSEGSVAVPDYIAIVEDEESPVSATTIVRTHERNYESVWALLRKVLLQLAPACAVFHRHPLAERRKLK